MKIFLYLQTVFHLYPIELQTNMYLVKWLSFVLVLSHLIVYGGEIDHRRNRTIAIFEKEQFFSPNDGSAGFGNKVSISGNFAIIGKDYDSSTTGSAVIFRRDDEGNWFEVQKLVAEDRHEGDWFGYSVDIDGQYAIVGAMYQDYDEASENYNYNTGAAYVFKMDGCGVWKQVQKLVDTNRRTEDLYGISVSMSDGVAIVGAYLDDEDATENDSISNAGSAFIYSLEADGYWRLKQKIVSHDRKEEQWFGRSLDLCGDRLIAGTFGEYIDTIGGNIMVGAGAAYIFEKQVDNTWLEVQKVVADDRSTGAWFGTDVSVYKDYAVVGAEQEDNDESGNDYLEDAGAVYVFHRDTLGVWSQMQKIVASDRSKDDQFGRFVAIDRSTIIIGTPRKDLSEDLLDAGVVYVYELDSTSKWNEIQVQSASDFSTSIAFGNGVGIHGNNYITVSSSKAYFYTSDQLSIINTEGLKDTQTVHLCSNEAYIIGDHSYADIGTFIDTLLNKDFCDSIVISIVDFSPVYLDTLDTSICIGDSLFIGGEYQKNAGFYADSLLNKAGCDSTIVYDLSILDKTPKNPSITLPICYKNAELSLDSQLVSDFIWYSDPSLKTDLWSGNFIEKEIVADQTVYLKAKTNGCFIEALIVQLDLKERPQAVNDQFDFKKGTEEVIPMLNNDVFDSVEIKLIEGLPYVTIEVMDSSMLLEVPTSLDWFEIRSFSYSICEQNCLLNCDTATVSLDEAAPSLIIPDYFTPNGDGVNDVLVIVNVAYYHKVHVVISDRNGNEIFKTDNYENQFDGTWRNRPLPTDTYFIMVTTNFVEPYFGQLTIER